MSYSFLTITVVITIIGIERCLLQRNQIAPYIYLYNVLRTVVPCDASGDERVTQMSTIAGNAVATPILSLSDARMPFCCFVDLDSMRIRQAILSFTTRVNP